MTPAALRAAFLAAASLFAIASSPAQEREFPIWPGPPPGSESWTHHETDYATRASKTSPKTWKMVRNVVTPTLTAFLPDASAANGTAVVICPGGGFRFLSWESEGTAVAAWLARRGVSAFVLKYRLVRMPDDQKEFDRTVKEWMASMHRQREMDASDPAHAIRTLATADGRQAVKYVRDHAAQWNLDPDRIGIMGFSAGGSVTMGVILDHDASSRPNFAAPIYGGEPIPPKLPADAPSLFMLMAQNDPSAHRLEKIYSDWYAAGGSGELHIFAQGGHGFGLRPQNLPVDHWIDLFGAWLASQGLLRAK